MLRYLRSARTPLSSLSPLSSLWARRSYRARLAAAQAAAAAAGTAPPLVYHVKVDRRRRLLRNAVLALGALYVTNSLVGTILRRLPVLDENGADDDLMAGYRNVNVVDRPRRPGKPDSDSDGRAAGETHETDEYDDDAEENEDDDEDYIDPNALFIPLPWTFQVVESPPYKGSDPEWQAYIRVSKDRDTLLRMRTEILEVVSRLAVANPVLVQRVGRDIKVRKHWLDLHFSQRPPPTVVRSGLLLSARSVALVTAEVDPVLSIKIQRALVPTAFAPAAYAFVKTLLYENATGVARYFGLGPTTSTTATTATTPLPRLDKVLSDSKISEAADPNAQTYDEFKKKIPSYELMRPGIQTAFAAFKKKWAETHRPIVAPPPRGSIGVTGLVELQSAVARIVLEVVAFWDPKTNKYDGPSMHVQLRSIKPRTRAPLDEEQARRRRSGDV